MVMKEGLSATEMGIDPDKLGIPKLNNREENKPDRRPELPVIEQETGAKEMIARGKNHLEIRAAEQAVVFGGKENREKWLGKSRTAFKQFIHDMYVRGYVGATSVVLGTVTNPHLIRFMGDPPDTPPDFGMAALAVAGPAIPGLFDAIKQGIINRGGV